MKERKFYAVVGSNCVAVMDTLKGAEKLLKYSPNAMIKEFDKFESAETWALFVYDSKLPPGSFYLDYLTLNHAIFRKNYKF